MGIEYFWYEKFFGTDKVTYARTRGSTKNSKLLTSYSFVYTTSCVFYFYLQNCSQLFRQHFRTRNDPSGGQYFTIREPVLHHPMSSTSPSGASTSPSIASTTPSIASTTPSGASTAPKLFFAQFFSWKFSGLK